MSPKAQKIEIARLCGWTAYPNMGECSGFIARSSNGESCYQNLGGTRETAIERNCPDYLNDLNAMHEAEGCMNCDEQASSDLFEYRCQLTTICGHDRDLAFFATASQRAEALLKVLGKWDDSK